MRRYAVFLALPIAAAVAAFYAGRGPSLQISFADVTAGPVTREVLTSGTLEPVGIVDVGTQVSGTIQSLHADFNALVQTGQVVARLDPSAFDAELAQAHARVIEAEGEAERMKVVDDDLRVKLARARELAASHLIAAVEGESAELAAKQAAANLTSAKAAVASAKALLKQAEVNRDHTVIRSPIDGIVVSRNVQIGETLAARVESPVLFRIADLRRMRLLAEIAESEVAGVAPGTRVVFEIEALGPVRFEGQVSEVRLQPTFETAVGTAGQGQTAAASGQTTAGAARATAGATQTTAGATQSTAGATQTTAGVTQATSGTAQTTAASTQSPAPTSGAVVSYTAIVNVENRDSRITPGSTAIVFLPTSQRSNAIRLPNKALSFQPAPDVLKIAGQEDLRVAPVDRQSDPARGRAGHVWKYEGKRFVPVPVRTGVSDEQWTELVDGAIRPGDRLVASATVAK